MGCRVEGLGLRFDDSGGVGFRVRVGGSRVERCGVRGSQAPGPGEYRAFVEGSAALRSDDRSLISLRRNPHPVTVV